MPFNKTIKILIVDDSIVFREAISKGLEKDPSIEVLATASDAFDARDKILKYQPDVMTLDVEMPRMNGIEFLKKLLPQYPLPVVVVSSVNKCVFDALNAGAVDFVTKPDIRLGYTMDGLINELKVKIKIAATSKVGHLKNVSSNNFISNKVQIQSKNTIIAIGASTGGTEAIYSIIRQFPQNMPPIVIVQHMPPVFTKLYAERLNNSCQLEVKEASSGDKVIPGRALIAPGDYQMRIKHTDNGYFVDCTKEEKVNGHAPSVDVLFESVSKYVGRNAIGIILTGMGNDGSKGLLSMKKNGARTIGQDEESCVVYGMPKVAFDIGAVDIKTSLEKIPQVLMSMI